MNTFDYRIFLIPKEYKDSLVSRMEGIVSFPNPVSNGDALEITLGEKTPYDVRGVVVRVDHRGFDNFNDKGKAHSSLFLQTLVSQEILNAYHERNGPHN